MSDMTFTPKLAVYKVEGSIAALIKEDTWDKLLKGEVIGVIEPDPDRYSLFINGGFIKAIRALNERRLNIKAEKAMESWRTAVPLPGEGPRFIKSVEVVPGYPNFIRLTPEKIQAYLDHGLTPEICANKIREFAKKSCGKLDNYMGVFTFLEEINNGMERQGRD